MSLALLGAGKAKDGAGAAAFAPTDLSGLTSWYKADALAQGDNTAVTSWADSSGTGRTLTQATGAAQPTFQTAELNGLPIVRFDGSDFMATAAAASPTAGVSVLVLHKPTIVGGVYHTLVCHDATTGWSPPYARVLLRVNGSDTAWEGYVNDAADTASGLTEPPGGATSGTYRQMSFVYDQTNLRLYRAGAQIATKARTGALDASTQPLHVGSSAEGADGYQGDIAELLIYNRGLTPTERGQVETYLTAKWGV